MHFNITHSQGFEFLHSFHKGSATFWCIQTNKEICVRMVTFQPSEMVNVIFVDFHHFILIFSTDYPVSKRHEKYSCYKGLHFKFKKKQWVALGHIERSPSILKPLSNHCQVCIYLFFRYYVLFWKMVYNIWLVVSICFMFPCFSSC